MDASTIAFRNMTESKTVKRFMSELMLEATEAIVKERNNVSLILQNNAGWGFFLHIPKNSPQQHYFYRGRFTFLTFYLMITDLNGTTKELSDSYFTPIAPAPIQQLSSMYISLPTKTPHHSSIQRTHNYYNTVTFFPITEFSLMTMVP